MKKVTAFNQAKYVTLIPGLDMGSEDDQSNASEKKVSVGEVHVSVAANETVGTSEGQTIMIIQEEPLENTEHTLDKNTVHITTSEVQQIFTF